MSDRPVLSLTLICKNEKHNVRRLLDSTWEHVDEVCVADTGSTDGTIAEFRRYAREKKQPEKLKTTRFEWCDDFAAARQAADELATGEWVIWADMDDTITGMDRLRPMAENATAEIEAFFCRYKYAADADGNAISELWRERVFRNNGTRWEGRLHEHKLVKKGGIVRVDPRIAEWLHHRDHTQRTGERNLRILEKWLADEPENARVMQSIAMEYMGDMRHADAAAMFARYLECPGEPPDRRAQAYRHMCVMLMMEKRVEEAGAAALKALAESWMWADTHLTLAEVAQTMGRPEQAITHANTAMQIGQPDTLLIINPLQYTAHPRAIVGVCLAQMGRLEEAVQMLEEALQVAPHYPLAAHQLPLVRGALKKEHAVKAVLALADVLVESGELLKARALVDQAPWYVVDDPRLVERRGELFRQIRERSGMPKVAVADEAADAFIERHQAVAA